MTASVSTILESLKLTLEADGPAVSQYLPYVNEALSADAARAQGAEAHPDDLAVDRFAAAMKAKLAQKRDEGRSGWDNPDECTIEFLSELLRDHVYKGDPVDVANFAMMIHQRESRILDKLAANLSLPSPPSALGGEKRLSRRLPKLAVRQQEHRDDFIERVREIIATPSAPQPTGREKILEEALRPFAERADSYDEIPGLIQFADDVELWQVANNKGIEIDITVGDLRHARAVLAGGEA